jgi:hypothetical protein
MNRSRFHTEICCVDPNKGRAPINQKLMLKMRVLTRRNALRKVHGTYAISGFSERMDMRRKPGWA